MSLEWVTALVTNYTLLAGGIGLCVYLFFTLKREIHSVELRRRKREQELQLAGEEMRQTLEALREALEKAGEGPAPAAPPAASLNMNKRAQALRMYRRGERPEQIAAALNVPLNEIELLLKVHRTVVRL